MITNVRRASALALLALAITGCGGGGGFDDDSNGGGGGGNGNVQPGRYLATFSGGAAVLGPTQMAVDMTVSGDGSVIGKMTSSSDIATQATFSGQFNSSGALLANFIDRVGSPGGSFQANGTFAGESSGFVTGTFQSGRGQFTFQNVTPYPAN